MLPIVTKSVYGKGRRLIGNSKNGGKSVIKFYFSDCGAGCVAAFSLRSARLDVPSESFSHVSFGTLEASEAQK